jgi:Fe-S cluster assembly protein SufD
MTSQLPAPDVQQTFQQLIDQAFKAGSIKSETTSPQWHKVRQAALDRFKQAGLPTRKSEEYRYTDLAPHFLPDLTIPTLNARSSFTANTWANKVLPIDFEANILVLINGRYEPSASSIVSHSSELEISALPDAARQNSRSFHAHFSQLTNHSANPLADLNTALGTDGIQLRIPEGKHLRIPILLLNITDTTASAPLTFPRILLSVGAGSSVTLAEYATGYGNSKGTCTTVTEVFLDDNATFTGIKFQEGNAGLAIIDSTYFKVGARANATLTTIMSGGSLIRNTLSFALAGTGAEATLNGLYMAGPKQHMDNYTQVQHLVEGCQSYELYKGVAKGNGSASFNGKIYVAPNAQKTNAYQSNRNILLDNTASIFTKPQLEIFADDVRCSHGATIGQLDDEAMFYLRSRGLDKEQAQSLLLKAFMGEVVRKITPSGLQMLANQLSDSFIN